MIKCPACKLNSCLILCKAMSKSRLYCRFCAEEKPCSDLLALNTQEDKISIIEKLSFLGIVFVDFSNKMLPETICIRCNELVTGSYEFFQRVKRSQVILNELRGIEVDTNASFPDELASCARVKEESTDNDDYLQDSFSYSWDDKALSPHMKDDVHMGIDGQTTLSVVKAEDITEVRNWAEYPALCQYCNLKMVDRQVLTRHCIESHRKCFGSQCLDCDQVVDRYQDFIQHVTTHRPQLKNICPYCNIDITHEDLHGNKHTDNQHPCSSCGELFPNKRALRAHEASVDPSHRPHKRRQRPLTDKDGLVTPLKQRKKGSKGVAGPLTEKEGDPSVRPLRKRRKGPLTDKDLTCHVCGMIMKSPSTLKVHIGTQHTVRKRNYTCDRCGKAYYTKGSLVVHNKIHENIPKETCKICHKAFLTVHRLRKHIKTHNLEMPFQCDRCQRFFSSKDRLREHVKVHGNVLPFQCQYCTKRFRHKSIMKTHENQHTGARPYSCNICWMEFANWSNCNKHMKRKHGTTLAQHAMTPHGKLRLDPVTGRPLPLAMDQAVRRWSQMMLKTRRSKGGDDLEVDDPSS